MLVIQVGSQARIVWKEDAIVTALAADFAALVVFEQVVVQHVGVKVAHVTKLAQLMLLSLVRRQVFAVVYPAGERVEFPWLQRNPQRKQTAAQRGRASSVRRRARSRTFCNRNN